MSQVGGAGSTRQVDYSPKKTEVSGAQTADQIAAGSLDGENIRFSREARQNEVLTGQQHRAPELEVPDDVKPTHLESANSDVGEIGTFTEKVATKTDALIQNARNGTLSPEQQASLKAHSENLNGVAQYLTQVSGKNVTSAEGKKAVLAGLGFNQSQVEALTSLAGSDKKNTLVSLHGSALQAKEEALKALGFSESQTEALLALADPNREASTLQAGSVPKSHLMSLGFSEAESVRLSSLLNGQTTGTDKQKQLLTQSGFTVGGADTILQAADPKLVKQQGVLNSGANTAQISALQQAAQSANILSTGNPVGDSVLKQLADIFVVLELLHEMSVQARRTARQTRAMEYDAAKAEVLKQAGEIRKSAFNNLVAGVVGGTAKIAGGMISIKGATAKTKAPDGVDANAAAQHKAAATQANIQKAGALSSIVGASGDVGAAGFNYQATMHQAKQKEHEAFQKTHENAAQAESEWMQLQQDMVRTVQSKMDEIIRTWFETLKTTTRG